MPGFVLQIPVVMAGNARLTGYMSVSGVDDADDADDQRWRRRQVRGKTARKNNATPQFVRSLPLFASSTFPYPTFCSELSAVEPDT